MFALRSSYIPKSQSAVPTMSVAGSVQWWNPTQCTVWAALIQSITWLHKAHPASKSFFHSSLWNQIDSSPNTKTRMSHLKLFFRQVSDNWVAVCPLLPCNNASEKPQGALPGAAGGWRQQAELFSLSPPPARLWTCWQQAAMKMVLSPTNLLDKQDCALHQRFFFVTLVNTFLACHSWQLSHKTALSGIRHSN